MADDYCCPKCGGREARAIPNVLKRHANPWVTYFGGWLLAALWSGSRKEQVRCVQCDTVFQRASRASKIAWVLFLLLAGLIVLGLWAEWSGTGDR